MASRFAVALDDVAVLLKSDEGAGLLGLLKRRAKWPLKCGHNHVNRRSWFMIARLLAGARLAESRRIDTIAIKVS